MEPRRLRTFGWSAIAAGLVALLTAAWLYAQGMMRIEQFGTPNQLVPASIIIGGVALVAIVSGTVAVRRVREGNLRAARRPSA